MNQVICNVVNNSIVKLNEQEEKLTENGICQAFNISAWKLVWKFSIHLVIFKNFIK